MRKKKVILRNIMIGEVYIKSHQPIVTITTKENKMTAL